MTRLLHLLPFGRKNPTAPPLQKRPEKQNWMPCAVSQWGRDEFQTLILLDPHQHHNSFPLFQRFLLNQLKWTASSWECAVASAWPRKCSCLLGEGFPKDCCPCSASRDLYYIQSTCQMLTMRIWNMEIAKRVSGLKGSPKHDHCQGELCVQHAFNRSIKYWFFCGLDDFTSHFGTVFCSLSCLRRYCISM